MAVSLNRYFLTVAVLAAVLFTPRGALAQFNPAADDAFAPLVIGDFPTRWFSSGEIVYRSMNGSDDVSISPYNTAIQRSVETWNTAMAAAGVGFQLNLQDWLPVLPDTTGTDPLNDSPVYCTTSPCSDSIEGTCLFKAYNTSGQYVCYTRNSSGQVISQTPAGTGECTEETVTRLCSLYVNWTLTGDPTAPEDFQPVRDSSGFIQPLGNGRNEIFVEEEDFETAVADFAADPSSTLALTVSRALVGGYNYAEIIEADIILNGTNLRVVTEEHPMGTDVTPRWSTTFIGGDSGNCSKGGISDQDTTLVPLSADELNRRLCYVSVATGEYAYKYDLQNVVTHELGHFLGYGHPCDDVSSTLRAQCRHQGEDPRTASNPIDKVSQTTMFWVAHEMQNTKRSLDLGDMNGLPEVFGTIFEDGTTIVTRTSGGCSAGNGQVLWPLVAAIAGALLWHLGLSRRRLARACLRRQPRYTLYTRVLAIVLAALVPAASALASTSIPLTTGELVGRADLLIEGVVQESRVKVRGSGAVNTEHRVEILDTYMGLPPADLWVAVPGGQVGNQLVTVAGAPTFVPGDRAFFFLTHSKGRWIVVGLSQGVKTVFRDSEGRLLVDAPRRASLKAASAEPEDLKVGLDEFREQLRDLVRGLGEKAAR